MRSGNDLHHGLIQILCGNHLPLLPDGQNGSLIQKILQVRTGETGRGQGNGLQVHLFIQPLIPGINLEDVLPALDVGRTHINLPVKPAGAHQGGVQNVLPVGGCQDNDAFVFLESIHLHQELVEGLLALIVSAAQARASAAADGVDLIDEDDWRGRPFLAWSNRSRTRLAPTPT